MVNTPSSRRATAWWHLAFLIYVKTVVPVSFWNLLVRLAFDIEEIEQRSLKVMFSA